MKLFVFGLNYKSSPVEMREKLDFNSSRRDRLIQFLSRSENRHCQSVVLSTCNRVEVYATVPDSLEPGKYMREFIEAVYGLDPGEIRKELYCKEGLNCAEHLFDVASGIDSMVVGETEILGQIKEAYYSALADDLTGAVLNRLFETALKTGKRVRTETRISDLPVSVSSVAVDMANHIFDSVKGKTILVVGAGEVGELTCNYLSDQEPGEVIVTSRTYDNAKNFPVGSGGRLFPMNSWSKVWNALILL